MDKAELEQIRKDAEEYLRDYPDDHRVRRQLRLIDHIDALEQKSSAEPVLDKPAKVGAGTFGVGVRWRTVIGAAQRHYEYAADEKDAMEIMNEWTLSDGALGVAAEEFTIQLIMNLRGLPRARAEKILQEAIAAAPEPLDVKL